jgi:TolA-binding protein
MKRKAFAIVLIVIISLALASWFVDNQFSSLQTQNSELQARNSELENQNSILQNQNGILENETTRLQEQNQQLQDQISHLQEHLGNSSSPVKIIAFEWQGGFLPIGGVTVVNTASVTIRNYSPVDISGLTWSARLVREYSGTEISSSGVKNVAPLQAGETRKIDANVYTAFGTSFARVDCVVTLMSGDAVLDEWTSSIG